MTIRTPPMLLAMLVAGCTAIPQWDFPETPRIAEIWMDRLRVCDVDDIVSMYDPRAVFLPATSATPLTRPEEIRGFYTEACRAIRRATIQSATLSSNTEEVIQGDTAVATGVMSFSGTLDRRPLEAQVRYSLTARKTNGRWLIVEHHSSPLPNLPR